MTEYRVTAKPWAEGWELHVEGVGVTQVRTLDKAPQQVRDLIETYSETDLGDAVIIIRHDLGGLEDEIARAREEVKRAEVARRAAAKNLRAVTRKMRAKHVSVSDSAKLLGVSRGRISQLVKEKTPTA